MKRAEDLKPGDEIVQDGVRFIVKGTAPLPDGNTAVYFEDMPATGGTGFLPPVKVEQNGWQNSKLRQFLIQNIERSAALHQAEKNRWVCTNSPELLKPTGAKIPEKEIIMEGRTWMRMAVAGWGADLRPYMEPGWVYLYEMNTTAFVRFDNKESAESFVEWAKINVDHWGYDPVAIIDTNDPEVRERWASHMEMPKTTQEKIEDGMIREVETGFTFLPSSYEMESTGGQAKWWARLQSEKKNEVVIVVEGGQVTGVYSTTKDLMVSLIDTDTDSPERAEEIAEDMADLQRRIDAGELTGLL